MELIRHWLDQNPDVVRTVHGLAFVLLGTAVAMQPKRHTEFRIARIFWWLVIYAYLHACADFAGVLGPRSALAWQRLVPLYLAYLFMFEFGRRTLALSRKKVPVFALLLALAAVGLGTAWAADRPRTFDVLVGYFIRFPGGLMAGFGLLLYARSETPPLEDFRAHKWCYAAGVSLLLWAMFSGVIRPPAEFFPANWLNSESFYETVGIPLQFFRNVCATATIASIIGLLQVFNRESERRLKDAIAFRDRLAEGLPEGILLLDKAKTVLWANPRAKELFGEVVGETYSEAFLKKVGAQSGRSPDVDEILRSGRPGTVLVPRRQPSGNSLMLQHTIYPMRDDTGGITQYVVLALDTTESRHAQERLLIQDTALRSAANAVIITDRDGRIVWINPAFTVHTGYTLEEVTGQTPRILRSGHHDAAFYQQLWTTILSGEVWHGELINRRKNGELYYEELTISPVVSANSDLTHFIGIMKDVTRRKESEDRLARSEERYRTLVETVPSIIVVFDCEGRIVEWNREAERAYGWSRDDVLGKRYAKLFAQDRQPEFNAIGKRILSGEIVRGYERVIRGRDGTEHYLLWNAYRLTDEHDQPVAVVAAGRDITEYRMLEGQFYQAQRLEAVGRLAGGVAHDFNNILTVIMNLSGSLLEDYSTHPAARQSLEEIQRATERAASLTRQLLAFSRRQVLQPKVLDLNGVVQGMEKMIRRLIGEDIEFQAVLAPGLCRVKADPGQLEQVIMNLVVNARDAMPTGGRLTIETGNVELDEAYIRTHPSSQAGPAVMLVVSDTGCGMDATTQARIFEPFFTTKEFSKGTGLGLSTVYGIVKQSQGNIWVYSEPGRGTTFKIYLPPVEADLEARPTPKVSLPSTTGRNETVLIVEDEESIRLLLSRFLERNGYKTIAASNGNEALQRCHANGGPIHLVLTDLVLPGMNGSELVQQLQQIHPGFKTLFMSGYTDHSVFQTGFLGPDTPFLQKPFLLNDLAAKVRAVLDGN
ncbi:MAG: PAS domain S-box protein [Candidatus Hydrogenedentes bacterium]|nr:PAS domain S-box protein [Candidatus Hydrogenedentota bacterium]